MGAQLGRRRPEQLPNERPGQGRPSAAGDVTAQGSSKGTGVCQGNMVQLSTSICNRGTAPVVDGTPVSFYEGTQLLGTALTKEALSPGLCTVVSCTGPHNQSGTHNVTISADDNGLGTSQTSDCKEGNNRANMSFTC